MRISSFKIFAFTIILIITGLFVIPQLSVKLNSSRSLPSITVSYVWPNASPYILERDVTSVLESGFSIIKGLQKLDSKSSKGNGSVTLNFDKYTDIDIARFEVATIIRQLYKQLPERTSYPVISANRPNDETQRAFLSYSINAKDTPYDIQETVKTQIEPVIGAMKGADKTTVYGANPKEYLLTYNTNLLKTLEFRKQDIITALNTWFGKQSLGDVVYNEEYITLSIQPQNTTVDWHIPIKKVSDRLVYLDEVTTVKEQEQEATSYYRINGENAVTLSVYATKNANTIALAHAIDKRLIELEQNLPQDYNLIKSYDSTIYLEAELSKIYERSLYTVIILLLFILLISKSIRYLWVTILSLVANIAIAFLLYYAFAIEIQLYSLAGITISLGLIIDNSIVMIDHIRHQNNKSVFVPILASTLTTIGALSIIHFLNEKYKVNLIDFALVIIINLSVSLGVTLYLIPALLEKLKLPRKKEKQWALNLKQKFYKSYQNTIRFQLRFKKMSIVVIILIFGLPVFMLPQKLDANETWYEKTYNTTLGNEWYLENARPFLDKYLGGSFRLFSYYVFDSAYYGRNEQTKLYVSASMEKGATVDQMNTVFIELENYLSQFGEIKQYNTSVYGGDYATIEVVFKEKYEESSFPFLLKSRLIRKALDFGGIDWNIYGVGNGFNNGGSSNEPVKFSVKAKGYNYDALNVWADSLKVALLEHPRIQKVLVRENSAYAKAPSYEYRFTLDKERLALASVSPQRVVDELKGLTLSKTQDISLNIKGKYTPIRLESNDAKAYDIWHIKNTPLDSLSKPIVLKDIAKVVKEREEENIYKENQEYLRLVEFQYTGAAKFGSKFLNEKLEELETKLPLGFTFERSEQQWYFNQDKNSNYGFLLVLVLSIIYLICSILFESLKQPFIILSVIPISFIGVFLTFYLFDFNFDQGGLASFVLLSGITVNASIFIINGFNKLRKTFPEKDSILLYIEAFKQKIFPILLTVVSTILGFIPFVKDGQNEVFWFALGVGTIGGLIFSLVGILFYLPVFTLKK
ncbi:efflux RND transporter permease subunit [Winogradskyella sp. PC-19]|uniref:efflux RND transporter permease subunit n=1 Tax=Winogradskyella sp. PC-19 TaxID=754417 RepID=UPI0018DFCE2F|nr:efflux RND transporter permease subunit [Winogradskyella sp. PC-19]